MSEEDELLPLFFFLSFSLSDDDEFRTLPCFPLLFRLSEDEDLLSFLFFFFLSSLSEEDERFFLLSLEELDDDLDGFLWPGFQVSFRSLEEDFPFFFLCLALSLDEDLDFLSLFELELDFFPRCFFILDRESDLEELRLLCFLFFFFPSIKKKIYSPFF